MLNLVNLLAGYGSMDSICDDLAPILRIVGIVIKGIEIVVPIILIVVGMLDLAKAVSEKDEGEIKKAEQKLVKRAIAAVLVFLVTFLVSILMTLVASNDYEKCMPCIRNPFSEKCTSSFNSDEE